MPRIRRQYVQPKDRQRERLVGFRIDPDRYHALQELSRRQRYTVAELINQALEAKFELAKLARIAKEEQLKLLPKEAAMTADEAAHFTKLMLGTKEKLVTCPSCGTPNFTARGLKAHRCKIGGRNGRF